MPNCKTYFAPITTTKFSNRACLNARRSTSDPFRDVLKKNDNQKQLLSERSVARVVSTTARYVRCEDALHGGCSLQELHASVISIRATACRYLSKLNRATIEGRVGLCADI